MPINTCTSWIFAGSRVKKRLHRIRLGSALTIKSTQSPGISMRGSTAFDDLVDLYDDDAAFEGSGLHDAGVSSVLKPV